MFQRFFRMGRGMPGNLIEFSASADQYPLLVKHLLHYPLSHAPDQEPIRVEAGGRRLRPGVGDRRQGRVGRGDGEAGVRADSLPTGKRTGNFAFQGRFGEKSSRNSERFYSLAPKFPYAGEQGIVSRRTANEFSLIHRKQGNTREFRLLCKSAAFEASAAVVRRVIRVLRHSN